MEENQFIDFNEIKKYVNVTEEKLFLLYLKEVFKDLADRDESNKRKGVMKMSFLDYIKLPIFISEKLFIVFAAIFFFSYHHIGVVLCCISFILIESFRQSFINIIQNF